MLRRLMVIEMMMGATGAYMTPGLFLLALKTTRDVILLSKRSLKSLGLGPVVSKGEIKGG